ncbi:MAG TPA: YceI family protein [Rhizomicrobium sp.]|jgi:polyisoprenoid-binding protein YceI|nr:YceI family protein [Rhizomicrobium sp.]
MKAVLFALAAACCLSTAPASAAQWTVDSAKSHLGFTVNWSNEPFSGTFTAWKADIAFDPADLAHSKASVSINLGSEKSQEAEFDDGLKGALGFQVSKFPTAVFETQTITHKDGDNYVAAGTLSLHGVTKPIMLPFTLTIEGGRAHMVGTATVVRTDFGIGTGMWAPPTPVAHEVKVNIDLVAVRSP